MVGVVSPTVGDSGDDIRKLAEIQEVVSDVLTILNDEDDDGEETLALPLPPPALPRRNQSVVPLALREEDDTEATAEFLQRQLQDIEPIPVPLPKAAAVATEPETITQPSWVVPSKHSLTTATKATAPTINGMFDNFLIEHGLDVYHQPM